MQVCGCSVIAATLNDFLAPMPKSPFEPCIPTKGTKVPDRPDWIHEIKHDGYRLIVQRDGARVRGYGPATVTIGLIAFR